MVKYFIEVIGQGQGEKTNEARSKHDAACSVYALCGWGDS